MRYGLTEETIAKINTVLASHPSIEKAVLFGSRAKGNFRPGSDIDLSLYGETISSKELGEISSELDDLLLPYSIDLNIFSDLDHAKLREHIERVGKVFYQRSGAVECQGCVVKTEWPYRALAEVCQIKPPKAEARRLIAGTDLVSFVPMEYLGIDQKILIPIQTKYLSEVAGSYTYFANGDVLLAKITPCFENGKLGIAANLISGIGFGSSEYIVFRPDHSLDKEWLYYFLSRETFRIEGAARMSGAVGHKRVSKEFIETYPIPVPPLPEQKRIVTILDEAFDSIATAKANAEKNLQNARTLFESHLQSVFTQRGEGWKRLRIEEACESIMDCVNKTAPKVEGPTPFKMIRTTNVRNGQVNLESVYYVTEEVFRIWTRRQVPKYGDVILTREAPMGEVGMLLSYDHVFLGQRLVSYRVDPAILDNRFLLYAFQSADIQGQIHALASGSTVQHMRVPESKNLQLSLPSRSKQYEIVIQLDYLRTETHRLESIYKQKSIALDSLKKSLLDQTFTGQL